MSNIILTLTSFDYKKTNPRKMEKISKKDIQANVKNIIEQALATYEISSPSSKTRKLVKDVSKKFSTQIKKEVKKKYKENRKAAERQYNKSGKVKKITHAA
jgi:hypothetical protein